MSRSPEREFLAAADELQRTPPLPAARALLWAIVAVLALGIVWACASEVDVVASAAGRTVPGTRVKTVQPAAAGVVTAIHVADGDRVGAGQVLIELDSTAARADRARLARERGTLAGDLARLRAQVRLARACAAAPSPGDCAVPTAPAATGEEAPLQGARLRHAVAAFTAALAALDEDMRGNRAERAALILDIERLSLTLAPLEERAGALRALADRTLASRHEYLVLEQQRLDQVRRRAVLRARRAVLDAAHAALQRRREALVQGTLNGWLDERAQVQARLAAVDAELDKVHERLEHTSLRAPVAGTVHALAVHTVGAVVTPAQALLHIVPRDDPLQVEAWLRNRDAGFVRPGQAARVKVEAFPFTRYGVLPATVAAIAADAVHDRERGLVYAARVHLHAQAIRTGERRTALAPGMAVTVEVALGRRRLIEYLLSPLLRYRDESLRER